MEIEKNTQDEIKLKNLVTGEIEVFRADEQREIRVPQGRFSPVNDFPQFPKGVTIVLNSPLELEHRKS